ncbi:CoA transferase [Arenimonas caeni]|uniref:CaiB/BaiF CoA transferase family protein n=1 Tax=Arenimonas caeni TaxID=2058085 RepID=UPI002A35A930|nr:CoA transferase [Arenimonas caeni]MDY0022875.1 CoA transferase [Arenimonas caeni]
MPPDGPHTMPGMGALSGITVLEFSRVLAGPWCGMTLADLGADVIKLESFDGDDTRGLGPPFLDGMSAYFACCNRNKRSLAIDLRTPASRPLLEALVREADVLVENYRTGGAEALGVGYEAMAAINPRLVYCSISGYGRDGPAAMRPGYDYVVQAEAGLMSITGPADGEPSKVGVAVADLATGQNAATAILAALLQRHRDGRGQRIDVSLFDSQLALLANVAGNALFTGADAPRYGNAHASIVPYQAFRASDGEFVLAVASEKLWIQLCNALGRDDWLRDPRFGNNAARVAHRDALCEALEGVFAGGTIGHWLALFEQAGVPAAPINSVRQALEHPVARARGMRVEIGGIPLVGSPIKLSGTPPRLERPPPKLGEHSDEIAGAFGFDPAALRAAGAIR